VTGVVLQQPPRRGDRSRDVSALLGQGDQPFQRDRVRPAEPLALRRDPVLITVRQQIAAVELDRAPEISLLVGGAGCLELGNIGPVRAIGPPLHCLRVSHQEVLGIGQRVEQLVEQVSQVGARLGFGGVGPKKERQVPTRLGRLAVEDQVDQQGLQARSVDGADSNTAVSQIELTQHLDAQLS